MAEQPFRQLFQHSWHPKDEQLLRFLDGELSERTARKIKIHLADCWECRNRRERMEASIRELMAHHLTEHSEISPNLPSQFRTRLRRYAAQQQVESSKKKTLRSRFYWLEMPRWGWAGAGMALAAFAFIGIRLSYPPVVSAGELLETTRHVQISAIGKVQLPVIYQRIQVQRNFSGPAREERAKWEIWKDPRQTRGVVHVNPETGTPPVSLAGMIPGQTSGAYNSALPPVLNGLCQVLGENRMDPWLPLSPEGFQAWRSSTSIQSDQVKVSRMPEGQETLTLTSIATPTERDHAILQADFVVRREDWHPVRQILQVREAGRSTEYDIMETHFQVLAFHALPREIAHLWNPAITPGTPSEQSLREIQPGSYLDSLDLEVQIHRLLHQQGACLENPITVGRNVYGEMEISGIIQDEMQRHKLEEAFRSMAGVRIHLRAYAGDEESMRDHWTDRQLPESISSQEPMREIQMNRSPLQDALEKHFLKEASQTGSASSERMNSAPRVNEFINRAIQQTGKAMTQAWALKRLAESFSEKIEKKLSPASRQLLMSMVHDHLTALHTELSDFQETLQPVLQEAFPEKWDTGKTSQKVPAPGWQHQARELFQSCQAIERKTAQLLAGTTPLPDSLEAAAGELSDSLNGALQAAAAEKEKTDALLTKD